MFKSLIATVLVILSLSLLGCSVGVSGLKSYVNPTGGYEFLYPNGWVPLDISKSIEGVDVVFRDIIEQTENLSVVISKVPEDRTLSDLGSPSEVGYRLLKIADKSLGSDRNIELINAEAHKSDSQTYYIFEYLVTPPNKEQRHNLASVAVNRGELYTFNISTTQRRWEKAKEVFEAAVNSFSLLY